MPARLRRSRARLTASDRGFTLIEMLVVVVIIGILAAIAIPLYLNYRKGAENKSAESDVRGAISAVEQFYTENGNVYPVNVNGLLNTNLTLALAAGAGTTQTVTVSPGNQVYFRNNGATYVICGQNTDGRAIYLYNSASGRPVGKSIQTTLANCVANGT
jgi:type IV pilus assembly protein PilA